VSGKPGHTVLIKPIPVEVVEATYQENAKEIITTGVTQAEEIILLKRLCRTVKEVNFSIGSYVQKDDILAALDTENIDNEIQLKTEEYEMKQKLLGATKEL